MRNHIIKRAAIATVLAVLGAGTSVQADEQVWLWQYELRFGHKQTIRRFPLSIRSEPTAMASGSRANEITPLRLPLYSSDPAAWSLLRFRASGEDSAGSSGFGTVVLGAVLVWQIVEAADAAGDAAADRVAEETMIDFEFTHIELPETGSSQGEPNGS